MPDEIKPITLRNAAEKFGLSYIELYNLGKTGQIALSQIGSVMMTEENSIKCYIELKSNLSKQKRYLDLILAEKREEIDNVIAAYDDYLFSMRSLSKCTRLFKILINELANTIKNDDYRKIFMEISLGQSIYDVACERSYSYDKVCSIYAKTIDLIEQQCSIIPEYRKTIASLKIEIRKKDILNHTLEDKISIIDKYNKIAADINPTKEIPIKAVYLLSLSIRRDLGLDNRTVNLLLAQHIYTIEDLFRYLYKHDCALESLLEIHGFGKSCFSNLKKILIGRNLIDIDGYSSLYKYIE